jgi:superfamily I DNA/RNA helicase
VLVSLTRSHSHRAVPLGEEPRHLEVALTRARDRLILLGDPGTLLRRSQWDGGPLDHLDEAATRREGRLAARLVGYLQGQGPHARAVRLCEGNCS